MYTVPFTEDSVREEICGRVMNAMISVVGSPVVSRGEELTLQEDGSNWLVQNGILEVIDEREMPIYKITGIEVVGGKAVLSGEALRIAGKQGITRVVVYEKSSLGTNFHIVVSSHVSYEEKAVPKLVRSIAMEGIPEDRVTVVVAGASGEITKEKGYTRVPVEGNLMGCTAFLYLMSDECSISSDYIVLLHDTCEAVSGFEETLKSVDVGLPFDVVNVWHEIGIWSMDFVERLKSIDGFNLAGVGNKDLLPMIMGLTSLRSRWDKPQTLKSRDIYGSGVRRTVYDIPQLGIRKYAGRDMTGGRP